MLRRKAVCAVSGNGTDWNGIQLHRAWRCSPERDPCSTYGAVCHEAEVESRRNYKTMTAQRFWDEIGKEMDRNG